MKKLAKSDKYKLIGDVSVEDAQALSSMSGVDKWRPMYHIHPAHGLLNDPNGFSYFEGKYHMFYQWYPFGVEHGMKHWAQVTSEDLIHWGAPSVALSPVHKYDARGCYSGAALVDDGHLNLFYTGNLKYDDGTRDATQCIATITPDGKVQKSEHNPIIKTVPDGYTGHVRDPKVLKVGDFFYMLLGAQTESERGAIIVYRASSLYAEWEFLGELNINFGDDNKLNQAYMWECPDLFKLDSKDVLVFSPQGVVPTGTQYQNEFNVVYCIGVLDWKNLTFEVEHYEEIDRGFDYYAPQTLVNDPKGRIIQVAWAGQGDPDFPSDQLGWANCLTFPRELSLRKNRLHQAPISNLSMLRKSKIDIKKSKDSFWVPSSTPRIEIYCRIKNSGEGKINFELLKSHHESLNLMLDLEENIVSLDRSEMAYIFNEEWGSVRNANYLLQDVFDVRILIDNSIIEIFIDNGGLVMTSRVFPEEGMIHVIKPDGNAIDISCYEISDSVIVKSAMY
ncbi:glycoside hydrolase family 32 protein [Vibrio maritimus]|uniref:glycoside hydrolase family 32 protein n=1 Tax=Vibrio maritimus TaxID=990268 RepID=UPI003735296B